MTRATDFGPSRTDLLEETSLQADVLDRISSLLLEKSDDVSARDGQLRICFLSENAVVRDPLNL